MYSVIHPTEPPALPDGFPPRKRHIFKKIWWTILFLAFAGILYFGVHLAKLGNSFIVEVPQERSGWRGVFCLVTTCLEPDVPEDKGPNPIPEPEQDRFDILILGNRGEIDTEEAGGLLTDTIMLLSVDKNTGKAALVSLPRDLHIEMTGTLDDGTPVAINGKLNEIYAHGYGNRQGLTFTSQMISRLTGVYVDRAALFDFQAFGEIIDALGGVDVTLARPFSEKTQWGYEFALPAGKNHLNGEQALYYVRSRYSSSDFDRARRQQEVVFAIKEKASRLGFLSNPIAISNLLKDLKGSLKTNFQLWEIKDMVELAATLKTEGLVSKVLSTENLLYESKGKHDEYILLPKGDSLVLFREYFRNLLNE